MTLTDGILTLRALEPTDLDMLFKWENDTSIWEVGSAIAPFSRKQLWDYIEGYDADIFSAKQLRLMIVEVETQCSVGMIDLFDFDPINRRAYIGLLVDAAYSGKGYGYKAVKLIEAYCVELGLYQLAAIIPVKNVACIALFDKLGWTLSGTLKDWILRGDNPSDARFYQKLLLT